MSSEVENKEITTKIESTTPVDNKQVESAPVETQEQINWKKFREQRDIERKQKEASDRKAQEKEAEALAMKAALDAVLNKQQPQQQQQNYGYSNESEETEDQKIEKRINAALEARDRQYDQQRREREQTELPNRLSNTYSDFNQICTTENLDYLEFHYPEVTAGFKRAPDDFDKWASIYKAVKRFVPNTSSGKDQRKAEANMNKPQSMSVPGVTQVGDSAPHKLDDKRKAENYARMMKTMKRA